VSASAEPVDFFDKARRAAVLVLLAAGALAVVGSLLDWATITRPALVEGTDFGDNNDQVVEEPSEPFTGMEAAYGYYSLAGGVFVMLGAVLLLARNRGKYAFVSFAASVLVGAIALVAYRQIADRTSALYLRLNIEGLARPAVGLTVVTAGAIIGLLASVAGLAATPRSPEPDPLGH
jgi:hypothetical protein